MNTGNNHGDDNQNNGDNGRSNDIVNAIFRVLIGLTIAYGVYQIFEIYLGSLI